MSTPGASRRARRLLRAVVPASSSKPGRQHNMREHDGEQYYRDQYFERLSPLLAQPIRVLDVGCQYGRFLLPLLDQGHDVVGTDIDADCLSYLRDLHPDADLRGESASDTARRHPAPGYDLILCLELLYLLPDWATILAGLAAQVAPGGHLAASHRSQGYYVHRLLRERRFDELDQLLAGEHPTLNAQTSDQLRDAYRDAGLGIDSITAIGAFSGIEVDPFAPITDPVRLGGRERARLMRYETDPALSARFMDSARYLLVVATPRAIR